MDEETREMDFRIADLEAEVKRLKRVECGSPCDESVQQSVGL
jgi:hypothetical protein